MDLMLKGEGILAPLARRFSLSSASVFTSNSNTKTQKAPELFFPRGKSFMYLIVHALELNNYI